MHLRGRQTTSADFPEARQLITDCFLYEDERIGELFEMWRQIIDGESGYSSVVIGDAPRPLLAFGLSVALKPQFLEGVFANPRPFTAKQIFEAWRRGNSPIMTREEVAEANAGWGVDLFILHHGYAPMHDESEDYAVMVALAAEFLQQHAGLNLRSMTQEFYDRSWLDITPRFGFSMRQDFLDHPAAAALPLNKRPFVAGIRRSEVVAPGRDDFLIDALFAHSPAPRLGLDAAQRQLLRALLEPENDARIDDAPHWNDLFDRISRTDSSFTSAASNGVERRERVLEWVRCHPEELHPYAMPGATQ
jgi:hypothetical protein